jgi:hypothetical protein
VPADITAFRSRIQKEPLADLVNEYLFQGPTFLFEKNPDTETELKAFLAGELGAAADNICIVGSAKTGFSLSPESFPRAFWAQSDVDVVVIDAILFDRTWDALLRWHYPFGGKDLSPGNRRWMRQRMDDIFWGWFYPANLQNSIRGETPPRITEIRDLSVRWFTTFKKAPAVAGQIQYEFRGRLYRTWGHARRYHVHGFSLLKSQLTPEP